MIVRKQLRLARAMLLGSATLIVSAVCLGTLAWERGRWFTVIACGAIVLANIILIGIQNRIINTLNTLIELEK